jgi:hypothetical protein
MRLALSTAETLPRMSAFDCEVGSNVPAGGPDSGAGVVLDASFNSSSNDGLLEDGVEGGKTTGVGTKDRSVVGEFSAGLGICDATADSGGGVAGCVGGFGGGVSAAVVVAETGAADEGACAGGGTVLKASTGAVDVGGPRSVEG